MTVAEDKVTMGCWDHANAIVTEREVTISGSLGICYVCMFVTITHCLNESETYNIRVLFSNMIMKLREKKGWAGFSTGSSLPNIDYYSNCAQLSQLIKSHDQPRCARAPECTELAAHAHMQRR